MKPDNSLLSLVCLLSANASLLFSPLPFFRLSFFSLRHCFSRLVPSPITLSAAVSLASGFSSCSCRRSLRSQLKPLSSSLFFLSSVSLSSRVAPLVTASLASCPPSSIPLAAAASLASGSSSCCRCRRSLRRERARSLALSRSARLLPLPQAFVFPLSLLSLVFYKLSVKRS